MSIPSSLKCVIEIVGGCRFALGGFRRLGRILPLAVCVAVLAAASPSPARMAADLKLRDTAASKVVILPQPNPHEQTDCDLCHIDRKYHGKMRPRMRQSVLTDAFLNDDYPDEVCYECHKGWIELHPTDIDPNKSRIKVSVPANVLPLRYLYEGTYKIVCMTCHDVHFPTNGFKLLRGFSLNPAAQTSRFTDRMSFCKSCHGDGFEYLTPHKVRSRQAGCTLCHVRKPSGGRTQPLRANVNALCTYCHPVLPEPHYFQFNPFPDVDSEVIWKSKVPLRDGAYTCITCHLPHGASDFPAYLREEFINLARMSVRINPHEKGVFCQSCHADPSLTRSSRQKKPALLEKNVNTLCLRCHGSGKVNGMHHPLKAPGPGMTIPAEMPLSREGQVTCITCHLPGCGPVTEENPNFLRVITPSVREFCLKCHAWTQFASRNIHAEYQNEQGCEVCHEQAMAAGAGLEVKPGALRVDQNFSCLQCHDPDPHPASHKHNVKMGNYDFVRMNFKVYPLDSYQRITCYTCHQVHQKTPVPSLLRSKDAQSSCLYCHPF